MNIVYNTTRLIRSIDMRPTVFIKGIIWSLNPLVPLGLYYMLKSVTFNKNVFRYYLSQTKRDLLLQEYYNIKIDR